jgi:hypothetical protein
MNRRYFVATAAISTTLMLVSNFVFALYDPKPDDALAAVQGEWKGSLTYRDYSKPDRLVTLPTKLFIALASPNELVLQYVFDDGPGKIVYSYERMKIDAEKNQLIWTTGSGDKPAAVYRIASNTAERGVRLINFDRKDDKDGKTVQRYSMELGAGAFKLEKSEVDAAGAAVFRNKYEFTRTRG